MVDFRQGGLFTKVEASVGIRGVLCTYLCNDFSTVSVFRFLSRVHLSAVLMLPLMKGPYHQMATEADARPRQIVRIITGNGEDREVDQGAEVEAEVETGIEAEAEAEVEVEVEVEAGEEDGLERRKDMAMTKERGAEVEVEAERRAEAEARKEIIERMRRSPSREREKNPDALYVHYLKKVGAPELEDKLVLIKQSTHPKLFRIFTKNYLDVQNAPRG